MCMPSAEEESSSWRKSKSKNCGELRTFAGITDFQWCKILCASVSVRVLDFCKVYSLKLNLPSREKR